MKQVEKEPFLPFVTVDDIVNFDIEKAETYTESKFINAVLRAVSKVGTADTQKIATFLEMEEHTINHGIRIACGFNLTFLRAIVTIKTAAQMHTENPACKLEDIAAHLGYADRSSIWAILNNKKYAEITSRLCPEMLQKRHNNITTKEEWERILFGINMPTSVSTS